MGLLSALGRSGYRALRSGEMFGASASQPMTKAELGALASRIAGGAYTEADVPLIRAVLEKARANQAGLTEAERRVLQQAMITTRNRKMGLMLNPAHYRDAPEEPWIDLLD